MEPSDAASGPRPVWRVLGVVVLCGIWGSTWLVIKAGLADLPVFTSAAVRFSLAAALLAAIASPLRRAEGGERPSAPLWVAMGLLNFAVPYGLVYTVETVIPSGLTSVLWAVFPMMTAAIAHRWLPGERLSRGQWLGFGLGLAGVGVLFATDLRAIGPQAMLFGALLLLSPLSAAVGQVVIKRHASRASSVLLNRNGMVLGAAALWLVALPTEHGDPVVLSTRAVGSVAYLALVGTVLAFTLYYWLLRYVSANRLSLIAYVTPAIALWLGWAVGGEPLAVSTIGGSVLIALGIALALRRRGSTRDPK